MTEPKAVPHNEKRGARMVRLLDQRGLEVDQIYMSYPPTSDTCVHGRRTFKRKLLKETDGRQEWVYVEVRLGQPDDDQEAAKGAGEEASEASEAPAEPKPKPKPRARRKKAPKRK